jgi:hypothetical protein
METIKIQPDKNTSINDLVSLQERGFSVMRSAHVGNLSTYNLSLAAKGIRMLLVDHNVTGVDKNYFPEFQLSQDADTRIVDDGYVVSRIKTSDDFLDTIHATAITDAIPVANVFTNTEYLQQNDTVAAEIVAVTLETMPELFERIVRSDGTTQKNVNAADLVAQFGVLQLQDDPRAEKLAVLMPNVIDILINFVIEAVHSQRDVQYHISGPDMITYIGSLQTTLDKLYAVIRQRVSFGKQLPAQLTVQLIPASSAQFATTETYRPNLEGLFVELDASKIALTSLNAERKNFFAQSDQANSALRQTFIAQSDARKLAIERALVNQADQVPGLFSERRTTGFITQYDVIKDGGLFSAEQNNSMTFNELDALAKYLQSLRKKVPS